MTGPVLLSRGLGRLLCVSWRRGCRGTAGVVSAPWRPSRQLQRATCSALQVETLRLPPSRPGTPGSLHRLATPASRPKGLPLCLPPPLGLGLLPGQNGGMAGRWGTLGRRQPEARKRFQPFPARQGRLRDQGQGSRVPQVRCRESGKKLETEPREWGSTTQLCWMLVSPG